MQLATTMAIFIMAMISYPVNALIGFDNLTGGYDFVVDIDQSVVNNCSEILMNLEKMFNNASLQLNAALNGRVYFKKIKIFLPDSWNSTCLPIGASELTASSTVTESDVTILRENKLFSNNLWTEQYTGCGESGRKIYIKSYSIVNSGLTGREFVKEWSKLRYGIFDEVGYSDDPIYSQCYFITNKQFRTGCQQLDCSTRLLKKNFTDESIHFCDNRTHNRYSPTKQNLLCRRQSAIDVIMAHKDFQYNTHLLLNAAGVSPIEFTYNYHSTINRYILLIDESTDMFIRESWNFLRNAIRKWILYDLKAINNEVGIILTNDNQQQQATPQSNKMLKLTPLIDQRSRDVVASFLPYIPDTKYQQQHLNIYAAINESMRQFNEHSAGNNIIIIISPGVQEYRPINIAAKLIAINYPNLSRKFAITKLIKQSANNENNAFIINESKLNSEKSNFLTYFELTNLFSYISNKNVAVNNDREIELYRKIIIDDGGGAAKNSIQIIQDKFYINEIMQQSYGFYIYTHNPELPLIQNIEVISPHGIVYNQRSDEFLSIKQLKLLVKFNETGIWQYRIERFIGNPQPHIIQIMGTSTYDLKINAWVEYHHQILIIFCQINYNNYPVQLARVNVLVTCINCIRKSEHLQLLDNGISSDLIKGDGIYSRYYQPSGRNDIYKFEIVINNNKNTAYTISNVVHAIQCCGSSINISNKFKLKNFEKYIQPITINLMDYTDNNFDINNNFEIGRINDLICHYLNDGKILLQWTQPDLGQLNMVENYYIKYSLDYQAIIDKFDELNSIIDTQLNFTQFQVGDLIEFLFDLNLYGNEIFFAIKPVTNKQQSTADNLISNIVRIFVPNKIVSVITSTENPAATTSITDFFNKEDYDFKIKYAISIITGTIFVLAVIFIYCIFCAYRRRKIYEKKLVKIQEEQQSMNSFPIRQDIKQHLKIDSNKCCMETGITADQYDLNKIGIPIYDQSQNCDIEQQLQSDCNDISFISSDQQQQILSPFESWTASRLLHGHEQHRHLLQIDDFLLNNYYKNQSNPKDVHKSLDNLSFNEQIQQSFNDYAVIGVDDAPDDKLFLMKDPSLVLIQQPQYSTATQLHQMNDVTSGIHMQGALHSNTDSNKKRRNVTMV